MQKIQNAFFSGFTEELEKIAVTYEQLKEFVKKNPDVKIVYPEGILPEKMRGGLISKAINKIVGKIPPEYKIVDLTTPGFGKGEINVMLSGDPALTTFLTHHELRERGKGLIRRLEKEKPFFSHVSPKVSLEDYNILKTLPEAEGKSFSVIKRLREDELQTLGNIAGLNKKELANLASMKRLPKATKKNLASAYESAFSKRLSGAEKQVNRILDIFSRFSKKPIPAKEMSPFISMMLKPRIAETMVRARRGTAVRLIPASILSTLLKGKIVS